MHIRCQFLEGIWKIKGGLEKMGKVILLMKPNCNRPLLARASKVDVVLTC
jgi:hypothetical protein